MLFQLVPITRSIFVWTPVSNRAGQLNFTQFYSTQVNSSITITIHIPLNCTHTASLFVRPGIVMRKPMTEARPAHLYRSNPIQLYVDSVSNDVHWYVNELFTILPVTL